MGIEEIDIMDLVRHDYDIKNQEGVFWFDGKPYSFDEWMKVMKGATKEQILKCPFCRRKFKKINAYQYKGDCPHIPHDMVIMVG